MTALPLPDKWVRKAVHDRIHNISVGAKTIPCYDYRTTKNLPKFFTLMSSQTATYNDGTKCGHQWDSSILLDIVTKYKGAGNPGSRLLADDIADAILQALDDMTLDPGSGLKIQKLEWNSEPDIVSLTPTENV
ncbi:MAG: hypothetical protein GY941_19430, partial [Planctomycetes bacterium]|nr:hypothetical protein [Planctomycetota bacterium]